MIKDIAYQLIQEGVKLDSSLKSFELQVRYEGKTYTVKVVKDGE
jgi:hypothetical protein